MFFDIRVDSVAPNALQGEAPHREPEHPRIHREQEHPEEQDHKKPPHNDAVLKYFPLDDLKKMVFKAIYFVVLRDPQLQGSAKVDTLDKLCIDIHEFSPAEMVAYLHQAITKLWRRGMISAESFELLKPLETYHSKLDSDGSDEGKQTDGGTMFELFELLNGKRVDTLAE